MMTMTFTAPRLTVLLPVYNAAPYLGEAVRSVLGQSFVDFELLAIDDGSTDESLDILRSFDDPRMRVERNDANLGLIATLNKGLDLARGEYVARMDGDDVAMPRRFEAQVALLDGDARLGACGMFIETFGFGRSKVLRYPVRNEQVQCHLLGYTPMAHPTVMFRKPMFDHHGLRYDRNFPHAEDYDLLERASHCFRLANIPEVGLRYRLHATQVSRVHSDILQESVSRIRSRRMKRFLQDECSEGVPSMLDIFFNTGRHVTSDEISAVRNWIDMVLDRNRCTRIFNDAELSEFLEARWINVCNRVSKKGMRLWNLYSSFPSRTHGTRFMFDRFKLFVKCVLK